LDALIGDIPTDKALKALSDQRTPEDPSLPQRLAAGLRWLSGDREAALNALRVLAESGSEPAAACQLGSMYACSGQASAAVEWFTTAASIDARYPCVNHRPAAYEAMRLEDPEGARKLLRARPPLERFGLRLLTSPGQRILSAAAGVGALFPLIAEEGSPLLMLAPAIIAAGLWLTSGAALPDWRRLAIGVSVIPAAAAIDLMEESGAWAGGVDATLGLLLLVVWLIVVVSLNVRLRGSPNVRLSASA
jgi:hypothetical protein